MKVYVVTCVEHKNGGRAEDNVRGVFADKHAAQQELDRCFHELCDKYGVEELGVNDYQNPDDFNIEDADICSYEAYGWITETELQSDDYPVVTVCRDDLEDKGYDTENITDDQMESLASKMGNAYLDDGFFIDLEICADALNLPKKGEEL